jgi:Fic family protein
MPEEDVRTTIRINAPGLEIREDAQDGGFNFDEASVAPVRPDPRYDLNDLRTLGQMERLAKAPFLLAEEAPDLDLADLDPADADTARSIALSVFASSEIEGEGVSAEHVEAFVTALTEPGEHVNAELRDRLDVQQDIKAAYFLALESRSGPALSYDFVLKIHKRMFENTQPHIAGFIKDREVYILWQRMDGSKVKVPTVAANRSEEFLRRLCERTADMFNAADRSSGTSMLLAAAEFACDFLAIHPFRDGNGRIARLLSSYLLERGGYHFTRVYPLDQIVLERRAKYYEALNASQRYWHTEKEDLTPWVKYFVGVVFEQWERAFRKVRDAAQPHPQEAEIRAIERALGTRVSIRKRVRNGKIELYFNSAEEMKQLLEKLAQDRSRSW